MTGKQMLVTYLVLTLGLGILWRFIPFKQYADVSGDPSFGGLIGATYQTLEDLEVLGITMDRDYKQIVDHFVIAAKPNFAGREVVSRERLKKGTLLRVSRILECSNCIFADGLEVEVDVLGSDRYAGAHVQLWSVPAILPRNSREQGLELNPALFRGADLPSSAVIE